MSKTLGEFEQIVLFSVVHLGSEAYGRAIRDSIKARTGRNPSPGAIYTTLGRLADRGIVTARLEGGSDRPGRRRKYYQLTRAGAQQLRASYEAIQAAADGVLSRLDTLQRADT